MKKNIVIGVLILLFAFFVVFAKTKADEAEKKVAEAQELAEAHLKTADEAMERAAYEAAKAEEARNHANLALEEAERQKQRADKCK